jgi:formate/nitrite transporter FocA (FNT family)
VVAVLLWKVLLVVLLPLIGIAAGFLFLVAKVVFVGAMVCVAIWLFRRLARRADKLA